MIRGKARGVLPTKPPAIKVGEAALALEDQRFIVGSQMADGEGRFIGGQRIQYLAPQLGQTFSLSHKDLSLVPGNSVNARRRDQAPAKRP